MQYRDKSIKIELAKINIQTGVTQTTDLTFNLFIFLAIIHF